MGATPTGQNADVSDFVQKIYKNYLGRQPSESDISYWNEKAAVGVSKNAIFGVVATSEEGKAFQDKMLAGGTQAGTVVDKLFQDYAGGNADEQSKRIHSAALQNGMSLDDMREVMMTSSAVQNYTAAHPLDQSNLQEQKDVLQSLKLNTLGAYTMRDSNDAVQPISSTVSTGNETVPSSDAAFVAKVYAGYLGHEASPYEISVGVSKLAAGTSREELLNSIATSSDARELQAAVLAGGNEFEGVVGQLFKDYTGQEADEETIKMHSVALQHGLGLEGVRDMSLTSEAAQSYIAENPVSEDELSNLQMAFDESLTEAGGLISSTEDVDISGGLVEEQSEGLAEDQISEEVGSSDTEGSVTQLPTSQQDDSSGQETSTDTQDQTSDSGSTQAPDTNTQQPDVDVKTPEDQHNDFPSEPSSGTEDVPADTPDTGVGEDSNGEQDEATSEVDASTEDSGQELPDAGTGPETVEEFEEEFTEGGVFEEDDSSALPVEDAGPQYAVDPAEATDAVEGMYQEMLGRPADDWAKNDPNGYAQKIMNGAMTMDQAAEDIANSREAAVNAYYNEYLGRSADDWARNNYAQGGQDIESVRKEIANSNEAYITKTVRNYYGRDATTEEKTRFDNELKSFMASGQTREKARFNMLLDVVDDAPAQDFQNINAGTSGQHSDDITQAWAGHFNTGPSQDDIKIHGAAMNGGMSQDDLHGYLNLAQGIPAFTEDN